MIEVAAAAVVLHWLLAENRGGRIDEAKERRAVRFIAVTFFSLGIYSYLLDCRRHPGFGDGRTA